MKVYIKISLVLAVALVKQAQSESDVPEPETCICTLEYSPVCASDGTTFANRCTFECAQKNKPELTSVCQHECPCKAFVSETALNKENPCLCSKLYAPVCASISNLPVLSLVTYPNKCYLRCAQRLDPSIVEVRSGRCDEEAATT